MSIILKKGNRVKTLINKDIFLIVFGLLLILVFLTLFFYSANRHSSSPVNYSNSIDKVVLLQQPVVSSRDIIIQKAVKQQPVVLEKKLMRNFTQKYFSELYLTSNPEIARQINDYCNSTPLTNEYQKYNCEQSLKSFNSWNKLYLYSGWLIHSAKPIYPAFFVLAILLIILYFITKLISHYTMINKYRNNAVERSSWEH